MRHQLLNLSPPGTVVKTYSIRIILLLILFCSGIFLSCSKSPGTKKLFFTGKIADDITGAGISGGGTIRVDGYNSNATGTLDNPWRENIGRGNINADGSFHVSFSEWSEATGYYFNFFYPNNTYINNGSEFLNTLYLSNFRFVNGGYTLTINAAKMTGLQINFKNLSPYNSNDLLHIALPAPTGDILFGYLMPGWENLQNCTVDQMEWNVSGGMNATGSLSCNVPADRRFIIKWKTRKNGIDQLFQDSVICLRNRTTVYTLNY
jgi:hypothetical protein